LEKFDADHAQQVPKPPAPKPGVPPGDLPPVPDPAPPPIENPGDAPLPPITDPDVIEPGEPNPAHTPMRVRGAKRSPESFAASLSTFKAGTVTRNERSNLFSSTELEHHDGGELGGSVNADGITPGASVNDLNPSKPENTYGEH
jgi:hypothetical protein